MYPLQIYRGLFCAVNTWVMFYIKGKNIYIFTVEKFCILSHIHGKIEVIHVLIDFIIIMPSCHISFCLNVRLHCSTGDGGRGSAEVNLSDFKLLWTWKKCVVKPHASGETVNRSLETQYLLEDQSPLCSLKTCMYLQQLCMTYGSKYFLLGGTFFQWGYYCWGRMTVKEDQVGSFFSVLSDNTANFFLMFGPLMSGELIHSFHHLPLDAQKRSKGKRCISNYKQ